jgi:hypothetical protein
VPSGPEAELDEALDPESGSKPPSRLRFLPKVVGESREFDWGD